MDESSNVLVNEDDKEDDRKNAAQKNDGIRVTACINGKVTSFEEFDKVYFKPVTDDESGDSSYLFRNDDEEKVEETNQVYSTPNVGEINENDTINITFSSVSTPRKTNKEFSFTFNTDPDKGPFLLAKQPRKQLSPIRPALFTSTPTRQPNSAAAGDNTDFLSSSIQQMHRELRRKNKVCRNCIFRCGFFLLDSDWSGMGSF